MKAIVLDLETTVQFGVVKDNSPFNPKNRIVSAHWRILEEGSIGPAQRAIFNHNEVLVPESAKKLREDLAACDTIVAHNAKFDVLYLLEAGFDLPEQVYCTMIGEYIFARGQHVELSLAKTAIRRDVTRKKGDLVGDLFKKGIGFEAMPLDTVIEYADADVLSCAEVYLAQLEELESSPGLKPTFKLMNEMLLFLSEIERNGIKIDLDKLDGVEQEFKAEKAQLEHDLNEIVLDVMGDTPINLNSGADMTKVIYSRSVKDKALHKETFNIGLNAKGKPLMPPRMSASGFTKAVRTTTEVVKQTVAEHCHRCKGRGKIQKFKKDGTPWKTKSKCPACGGAGALYSPNGKVAGLRLVPTGPRDASINGFKTDKATIKRLVAQAEGKGNLKAIQFLTKLVRLNAISTYLDSFVKGIQTWTRPSGLLHANFNQTTTRTGRLSSSNPNFQNQPSGKTFPIRKCVVSRFEGGEVMEADFSGLEFRVAGELSRDPQIIEDILGGKDVHKQTASIIQQCAVSDVDSDMRKSAKAYTFAPLYGGTGANEAPHVQKYFKEYFNIYKGLAGWHRKLMDGVLKDGIVRIPSGREFYFPHVRRTGNGKVTNATQVVNWPVQSFATADIVPLACVRAYRAFKKHNLQSKLILTVHDSIVVDLHPAEKDIVVRALVWAMRDVAKELQMRFSYETVLPLDIEIESGPNWMVSEVINF
jgi:DNA polymerase I-like protein with 3'-5' exonuclease and polymerase domains